MISHSKPSAYEYEAQDRGDSVLMPRHPSTEIIEFMKPMCGGSPDKAHEAYDRAVAAGQSAPDEDGWIRHNGGPCPVASGTMVDVAFRDGDISPNQPASFWTGTSSDTHEEDWWAWLQSDKVSECDITGYRLCAGDTPDDAARNAALNPIRGDAGRAGGEPPKWLDRTPPEAFDAWAKDVGAWQRIALKEHRKRETAEAALAEERMKSKTDRRVLEMDGFSCTPEHSLDIAFMVSCAEGAVIRQPNVGREIADVLLQYLEGRISPNEVREICNEDLSNERADNDRA